MAAVSSPHRPSPPPSSSTDDDDQFAHIKYSITTTPPQPRRTLQPNNSTTSPSSKLSTSSTPTKNNQSSSSDYDKAKFHPHEEQKQAKGDTDHHHDKHDVDYSKEDNCHRLHPSLHFIPEDKEHPPKQIVPSHPKPSSPSTSPASSPVSSPAPANSPSTSPNAGPRRLSQRQQKKALRAQQSADDGDVDSGAATPSKLRLLAPPPINSKRGGGSGSRSPSPTPSPSPPPSPYLSPDHPKRRGSFASAVNSFVPVHDLMEELTPNKISRHPYVLYPGLFFIALSLSMLVLRVQFTAPFFAVLSGFRWVVSHPSVSMAVVAVMLGGLGTVYRRAVYGMYKAAFLPPAGDVLPRPFKVESIDLTDPKWQKKMATWAQQIDANNSVEEATLPSTPSTDSSPQPKEEGGVASFDSLSGANALALMECYQRGKLDDCDFHCLRIFLADPSMNKTDDGDDTVAITFLSIKCHYDLSPYLLRVFTPIQACFPFLCAPALFSHTIRRWMSFRFCVVGFHWPFRQCVVFTKPLDAFKAYLQLDEAKMDGLTEATDEKKRVQVARYTSVLQLVQQFDAEQPKGKRSDFMLFPVLTQSCVRDAIEAAGGAALPILPTYVVDLRKVKGGEWQDYKRHLRKTMNRKVREGPFEGAGGSTDLTEGDQVTEQQAMTLVSLWHQVADYRGNKDQTVCMMEPNSRYILELAHHRSRFIQFLALKLKDTTVAASLLFSLSHQVMTSDVAGFNYPALEAAGKEANQQIKAYPVKLAAVLKVAIASGYEWVDFGPTTGSSKMEIGAKEVPITGGLFYHGAMTSIIVKIIASCLSRQHTVAKKAYE